MYPLLVGFVDERLKATAEKLEWLYKSGDIAGVYAANQGHAHIFKGYDIPVFFDEGMNLYNLHSVREGIRTGMKWGVISHELKPEELKEFLPAAKYCEITVGGRIPLMHMEHCPTGSGKWVGTDMEPCTAEKKRHHCRRSKFVLKDRMGETFPVLADDSCCRSMILSHRSLFVKNYKQVIASGFNKFRVCIYDEMPENIDILTFIWSNIMYT